MSDTILYCVVGGPPENWNQLRVFRYGVELCDVREVNVVEGWAIRYKRDHFNRLVTNWEGELEEETIEGEFEIHAMEEKDQKS